MWLQPFSLWLFRYRRPIVQHRPKPNQKQLTNNQILTQTLTRDFGGAGMGNSKAKLNDGICKALEPRAKQYYVADDRQPKLAIRVYPSGRKVWGLNVWHTGQSRWLPLGTFQVSMGATLQMCRIDAVRAAQERLAQIGGPDDPFTAKRTDAQVPTLAEWFADYAARNPRRNESETLRGHQVRFETYAAPFKVKLAGVTVTLGAMPLDKIESFHLDDLRDSILATMQAEAQQLLQLRIKAKRAPKGSTVADTTGARTANLVLARINTLLIDAHNRKQLPAGWQRPRASDKAQEAGQDETNHIKLQQAAAFYGAVDALRNRAGYKVGNNHTIADIILVCLWTGGRIGNVTSMRWDELDLDAGTWNIPRSKFKTRKKMAGSHKHIPLTLHVVQLLRNRQAASKSQWVFPTWDDQEKHIQDIRKSQAWVMVQAGIKQRVTIHGLRHSLGTWLHQAGAPLKVIAAQLGQADLESAQRYAHDDTSHTRGLTDGAIAASFTVIDGTQPGVSVALAVDEWAEVLVRMAGHPLAAKISEAAGLRRIG